MSDLANQATLKIDHQVGRRLRSSATFAWYGSKEPGELLYDGQPSDPLLGFVDREVHVLALNNLFTPGGASVYELRFGYLSFADDFLVPAFDVTQLGFASRYTSALPPSQFPGIGLAPTAEWALAFRG